MFAQIFPEFLDNSRFSVVPSLYKGYENKLVSVDEKPLSANPNGQGIIAFLSIIVNICVICTIFKRWIERNRNAYTHPIFNDSDDYIDAYKRIGQGETEEIIKNESSV